MMVLLENDAFLTGLTKLFHQAKSSGSVFLTMKKYNGRTKPHPKPRRDRPGENGAAPPPYSSGMATKSSPEPADEHLCLLRAGNGKKHISTVVSSREVTKFQMAYANVLKANIDGLKKREKKTGGGGGGGGKGGSETTGPKRKRKASTH